MRVRSRRFPLCRLLGSCLAVTGLLGHGLAMLLVTFLTSAPMPAGAAAEVPGLGILCTAEGIVVLAADGEHRQGTPAPGHPTGHLDPCPICTAFAQSSHADLPSSSALPAAGPPDAAPPPAHDTQPPSANGLIPLSRGPPAVA